MFFRLKHSKSGQVLQLLESYRNQEGQPRQRVVVSLGDAALSRSDWRPLASAVQKRLYGIDDLLPPEHTRRQQNWIEIILRRIDEQGRWGALQPLGRASQGPSTEVDGVLLEKLDHGESGLLLGPILLGLQGWKQLRLDEACKEVGFTRAQIEAAQASVINRLVEPVSENALPQWVRQTALGDLLGSAVGKADRHRYYRVSDLLVENRERLEGHLRQRQGELFDLDRTILLYDLTNTHFEGVCGGNKQARRGKNKQKRHDCAQIVVGMVFDREGFELGHRIFAGNRHDSTTLVEMIEELQKAAGSAQSAGRALIIRDAGVASEENVRLLGEAGFSYLVNDTRRLRGRYGEAFLEEEGFEPLPGRKPGQEVKVKLIEQPLSQARPGQAEGPAPQEGLSEFVLLCKSRRRGAKEEAMLSGAEVRYTEALQKLQKRVQEGKLKDPEKIQRSIGRVQGQHPRVQRFYQIELNKVLCEGQPEQCQLSFRRKDQACEKERELLGCYVLRTDQADLAGTDLWQLYMTLTRAEDGFKALKSDLGLRPNRHHIEPRVDAHVFISILAYHLLRFIEYTLERHGDNRCWQSIKRVMQTHTYATLTVPTKYGEIFRIRKAGIPEASHKQIYHLFHIDWKNLPVKKTGVKRKSRTTL